MRNVQQDLSGDHRRVKSVGIERQQMGAGSACLLRPFGWFVPLAMLFAVSDQAALFGASGGDLHFDSYALLPVLFLWMSVLTLGMPEALRRGLAKCTSRTRVIGMTVSAMLVTALITAAVFALMTGWLGVYVVPEVVIAPLYGLNDRFSMYALDNVNVGLLISGLLVGIRCLEEFFAADGDNVSAVMLDVLAAVAVYAMSLLSNIQPTLLAPVLGGILLIGVVVALVTGRRHARTGERLRLELVPLIKEVPSALLRVGLYPVLAVLVLMGSADLFERMPGEALMMLVLGMVVVELGRSTFRRDAREAAGYVIAVTHLSALAALVLMGLSMYLGGEVWIWPVRGLFVYLAVGVLMLLYAPLNWRMVVSGILLVAAGMFTVFWHQNYDTAFAVIAALNLGSALLMIPEWRELARIRKVKRIRAKAMRGRR